jgi:hypothetical protein
MNLPYRFDPGINVFALFFSGLIGVIFGYFQPGGPRAWTRLRRFDMNKSAF